MKIKEIDTKYIPGMFVNTRKYFDNKTKFLIQENGNVITKFNINFRIKNTKNLFDILQEISTNKRYKNLKIICITIVSISDNMFINYVFENNNNNNNIIKLIHWDISKNNYYLI
jgi:hypothetical protein